MIRTSDLGGVGRRSDQLPAFARGRVCGEPGCDTRLSIYNPAPFCALHAANVNAAPRRAASRSPLEERACGGCGSVFATSNPRRRYCSDACRAKAWTQRGRPAADALQQGMGSTASTWVP
jgi:hypothetical protein